MASNRALTPRDSPFAFGAHLLLTLLTLCLVFEILRFLTFTSATPINHLAQRREDSGSDGPFPYYGVIDITVKTSGNPKRDFRDSLNSAFEDLGNTTESIFDPDLDLDENSKRDFSDDFWGALNDVGNSIKSIFHPSDKEDTPVEAVSEYAYNELNQQIPLKDLKEAFKKTYGKMKHSGNKQADDDHWILDQVENVIPELKKKYDEANKSKSASASTHHERDTREGFKTMFKDFGIKIRANFVYEGENMSPVDWISQYAYDKFNHYFPFEELKDRFERSYEVTGQKNNQTADDIWINDEIDNEFPKLKEIYKASKKDNASKNHGRDAGDKLRPLPGTPAYYLDPSFFPYPMPPTPNITEELKTSLGDAFNNWRAGNITEDADKNCTSGLATCNKADANTTKVDWTPNKERQRMVEACIQSLIEDPSCFVKYQSTNVLKPYLTELVDQGKIKDEDGKIKKFYKRGQIKPGVYDAPKLVLSQNFLDILTTAYKKYKEDIAIHSDMSCPLTTDNVCENAGLASNSIGPNAPSHDERQQMLETCIVFISWHPNCLQRYETKDFIKPYLEDLADSGKIDVELRKPYLTPANNESATPDAHDNSNVTVQARDGVLVDPLEENRKALAQYCKGKKPTGICATV